MEQTYSPLTVHWKVIKGKAYVFPSVTEPMAMSHVKFKKCHHADFRDVVP